AQGPPEAVARYRGGLRRVDGSSFERRPVTILDAGWRRDLDLRVIWPAGPDRPPGAGTIWPAIEDKLAAMIREHRSTIIFTNNRRQVEKLTARLNELGGGISTGSGDPRRSPAPNAIELSPDRKGGAEALPLPDG